MAEEKTPSDELSYGEITKMAFACGFDILSRAHQIAHEAEDSADDFDELFEYIATAMLEAFLVGKTQAPRDYQKGGYRGALPERRPRGIIIRAPRDEDNNAS